CRTTGAGQRDRPGCPAPVVRQLAGIAVPPGQQHAVPVTMPLGSVVAGHLQHRPVIVPGALGPDPVRIRCQARTGIRPAAAAAVRVRPELAVTVWLARTAIT